MKFEEFLYDQSSSRGDVAPSQLARSEEPSSSPEPEEEIEIQKAVVESLAADKVKIEEEVVLARERSAALEREVKALKDELALMADRIARNEVTPDSSKVALLERNVELDDRFDGETRDHVLEVLREARDAAEKEGRNRRAQLLEAVLIENAPVGELAARRAALEKLFADNGNIVNGEVMRQLAKLTIQYREGETYLLPAEILKRIY